MTANQARENTPAWVGARILRACHSACHTRSLLAATGLLARRGSDADDSGLNGSGDSKSELATARATNPG